MRAETKRGRTEARKTKAETDQNERASHEHKHLEIHQLSNLINVARLNPALKFKQCFEFWATS